MASLKSKIFGIVAGVSFFAVAVTITADALMIIEIDLIRNTKQVLIFLGILIMFLLAVSAVLSSLLIKPFDDLIIAMQLASEGHFGHIIKRKGKDEAAKLARSFNIMTKKLKQTTERKDTLSKLAAIEKNKAELIINSMTEAVIVTNSEHKIELLNASAEKLFDVDAEKQIGKHIVNLLKRYRLESLFDEFPDINSLVPLRKFQPKIRELEMLPSKKVLKVTIAPLRNETNHTIGIILVFEDITRLKEIDNMKTEFVSVVSHELRTPLTSIKGYAALLADEKLGKLKGMQKKAAKVIDIESNRLEQLINDILDLSRLESKKAKLKLELISLEECLKEAPVKSLLAMAEKKGISIQKSIIGKKENRIIYGDKLKLTQVFTNLLSNAIKFTKEKGIITIRVYDNKSHVIAEVSDSGTGIAKKELPKLFNKFYQVESHLKRNQRGTGLGLAIVKEVIALHHGLISISSKPGKGTKISFALPKKRVSKSKKEWKCWEQKSCKKLKCPAYECQDTRCWLVIGTLCKRSSKEPCFDKISLCSHCSIYKSFFEEDSLENSSKKAESTKIKNSSKKKAALR